MENDLGIPYGANGGIEEQLGVVSPAVKKTTPVVKKTTTTAAKPAATKAAPVKPTTTTVKKTTTTEPAKKILWLFPATKRNYFLVFGGIIVIIGAGYYLYKKYKK